MRRMLLNSLMQYPLPAEEVIRNAVEKMGLTREDVLAAARWWNVTEENRDGEVFWHKPDVLVLLPSCPQNFLPRPSSAGPRRRRVQPECRRMRQGSRRRSK